MLQSHLVLGPGAKHPFQRYTMSGTQHQNLCVGEFVDDILSGKERVIPFSNISGPAWRNTTMCALIALNFARLAFQHQRRTRGLIGTFIGNIAKRTFIEVSDLISLNIFLKATATTMPTGRVVCL